MVGTFDVYPCFPRSRILQHRDIDDFRHHLRTYLCEVRIFSAINHERHGIGIILALQINKVIVLLVNPFFPVKLSFGIDIAAILIGVFRTDDADIGVILRSKAGLFQVCLPPVPDNDVFPGDLCRANIPEKW